MIVSHQHRFIYIKSFKTASTSVQYALARHCGEGDIVTAIRGCRELEHLPPSYVSTNEIGGHLPWKKVREMVFPEEWHLYLKVVNVRNPWDMMVSWFHTKMEHLHEQVPGMPVTGMPTNFTEFVGWHLQENCCPVNMEMWLDGSVPWADFIVRYESLQYDINRLFRKLRLEYQGLPCLRPTVGKRHYSCYYDVATRRKVEKSYAPVIDLFGYDFEHGTCEERMP